MGVTGQPGSGGHYPGNIAPGTPSEASDPTPVVAVGGLVHAAGFASDPVVDMPVHLSGVCTITYPTLGQPWHVLVTLGGTATVRFAVREYYPIHLSGICQITTWGGQLPIVVLHGITTIAFNRTLSPLSGVLQHLGGTCYVRFLNGVAADTVGFVPIE